MSLSPQNELSYLGVRAPNPPNLIKQTRVPTAQDYKFPIGTLWVDSTSATAYILVDVIGQTAFWDEIGAGASIIATINANAPIAGNYTVSGSPAQILAVQTPGTTTFSLSNAITTPGSLTTTTTLTGGTGITATAGNIVATAGNISATVGSVSAATTVTAGTGITATTGNIVASTGNITSTLGSMSAATTVTGGTGLVATTGNIVASTGNITSTLGSVAAATTVTGGTGVVATTGNVVATAGAVNAGTSMTATLGNITATNGNVSLGTAGNKLLINAGANGSVGTTVALIGGTLVVANSSVTANSKFFFTTNTLGTVVLPSAYYVSARTPGVNFTILSNQATDTSTVDFFFIN
jgi:hypothetical protein